MIFYGFSAINTVLKIILSLFKCELEPGMIKAHSRYRGTSDERDLLSGPFFMVVTKLRGTNGRNR